jgi:serine protease
MFVPVLALSSTDYQRDAGVHYIQLINSNNGEAIKQVFANASNGEYTFTMENIPFGNYILIAGSNPDNNGFICESAEACGEYPSIGYVEEITIDESSPAVSTFSFETGFNQIAISQGQGQHHLP